MNSSSVRQKKTMLQTKKHVSYFSKISYSEFLFPFIFGLVLALIVFLSITRSRQFIPVFDVTLSVILTVQGIFFLFLMLYAWENEKKIDGNKTNQIKSTQQCSITALVPARHEASVIADTILAIDKISYPDSLKETIVICRYDDPETIKNAKQAIVQSGKNNIKLLISKSLPINKPHSLNLGLKKASHEIIAIFDAEDQPHGNLYNTINEVFQNEKVDVIQSGVQLMNFRSSWFSLFNVLEYYFWFKSSLHFFAKKGTVPLGGNSVFFKKTILNDIGGWDETCLTEDADIGLRLSIKGAKIKILYHEGNATQEETPTTITSFIKQRTRWNQGFIQILLKGEWLNLPKKRQRFLAGYILLIPELQSLFFLIIPISIIMAFTLKLSIVLSMLTLLPLILLFIQLVMLNVGLYEFTKSYNLKYPIWMSLFTFVFFYPYQILLGLSAFRAVIRMVTRNINWEKTHHINAHREKLEFTTLRPAVLT